MLNKLYFRLIKLAVVSLAFLVTISGCAQWSELLTIPEKPTAEQLAKADYGPYPSDYEKLVRDYMHGVVRDAYSARYRFHDKRPVVAWKPVSNKITYGWRVCVGVNAKNQWGAYEGEKLNYFFIRDGRIIKREGGPDTFSLKLARRLCAEPAAK